MPIDESFEDRLGTVLRHTGDTFEPDDHTALVAGGEKKGRRAKSRRRAVALGGSVLALAVVGVGGSYGAGLLDASTKPVPVAAPSWSITSDANATPAQKEMAGVLARLIPSGRLLDVTANGRTPGVTGLFDDDKGAAEVTVGIQRVSVPAAGSQVTCPDKVFSRHDHCSTTELADGSRLMILQGYEYPDARAKTKLWRAVLLTRDGFLVDLSEYNAPAEKGARASRPNPPFDPAQLKDIITSEAWRAPMGMVPKSRAPEPTPADTAPTMRRVDTTLRSLLPRGLKVVDQGHQEFEFGYVVVDDGHGRSLVQVNVQSDMQGVEGQLFGAGTTVLPDGTKLKTQKGPGEKGGQGVVMWTADTIRPDGLRVVISAINAGDPHSPATRETPALTMKQLTAIATNSTWLPGS